MATQPIPIKPHNSILDRIRDQYNIASSPPTNIFSESNESQDVVIVSPNSIYQLSKERTKKNMFETMLAYNIKTHSAPK